MGNWCIEYATHRLNYVKKEENKLIPSDIGILVSDLLVEHFPKVVDYEFTAKMENELDDIAIDKKEWQPVVREFYEPFAANLKEKEKELDKKEITHENQDADPKKPSDQLGYHSGVFLQSGRLKGLTP